MTIPNGWSERGSSQPEFDGPNGAAVKIAIGAFSGSANVESMKSELVRIASKYNHWIVEVSSIIVRERDHATIVYHMPLHSGRTLRVKNFHLIFGKTEYVITCKIALFSGPIGSVGGQPVQALDTLYAYNEDYDDMIRTFNPWIF